MISIDTNVLFRYLLQDDEAQSKKANKLFLGQDKILITDIVLAETMWTLKGKKYKFTKEQLLTVVDGLFRDLSINFEDGQSVWRALHRLRASKPIKVGSKKKDVDFSDL
ncbi:MAG: putative nucleic-acid-binding protein [Polaribacter sp.]|jgi:predicted nucleic-acid-binding protein